MLLCGAITSSYKFQLLVDMGKATLLIPGCSGFIQRKFILIQANAKLQGWINWAWIVGQGFPESSNYGKI